MKKILCILLLLLMPLSSQAEFTYNILSPINIDYYIDRYTTVPTNATDACTAGQYALQSGYAYFCVSDNTWQRVVVAGWAVTDVLLLDGGSDKLLLSDGSSFLLIR